MALLHLVNYGRHEDALQVSLPGHKKFEATPDGPARAPERLPIADVVVERPDDV